MLKNKKVITTVCDVKYSKRAFHQLVKIKTFRLFSVEYNN